MSANATPATVTVADLAAAHSALAGTVEAMTDTDVAGASGCDGWTRGHVITHIARNGDGMHQLVTWALTGVVTPMYASGRRNPDIDDGAGRSAAALQADVEISNGVALDAFERLTAAIDDDPQTADRIVRLGEDTVNGPAVPAADLAFLRLQEVVLHHHDLDLGLTADDWPGVYVDLALPRMLRRHAAAGDLPRVIVDDTVVHDATERQDALTVAGEAPAVLAWLTGRLDPARHGLDVHGGTLPILSL